MSTVTVVANCFMTCPSYWKREQNRKLMQDLDLAMFLLAASGSESPPPSVGVPKSRLEMEEQVWPLLG